MGKESKHLQQNPKTAKISKADMFYVFLCVLHCPLRAILIYNRSQFFS